MKNNNFWSFFFLGLLIATGITAGGYFISKTLYNSKVALNTAEVKGLAERRVKADTANWSIGFSVAGATRNEIPVLYKKAEKQQQTIVKLLKENGFKDNEISIGIIDYDYKEYRDDAQNLVDQKHILRGTINIETSEVDKVGKARANINKLISQGINVNNGSPMYLFTRLNEIKPDMLKEATRNARIAANEFAANAGVEVGGIRSARQGGFIIRDAGADYGDTEKMEKDVRVVTTITFFLTE